MDFIASSELTEPETGDAIDGDIPDVEIQDQTPESDIVESEPNNQDNEFKSNKKHYLDKLDKDVINEMAREIGWNPNGKKSALEYVKESKTYAVSSKKLLRV